MGRHYNQLEDYRKQAIKAARDFRYPRDVIAKLWEAKTEREISNIMKQARQESVK